MEYQFVSKIRVYSKIKVPILAKQNWYTAWVTLFIMFLCHNFLDCLIFKRIQTKTSKIAIISIFMQPFFIFGNWKVLKVWIFFKKYGKSAQKRIQNWGIDTAKLRWNMKQKFCSAAKVFKNRGFSVNDIRNRTKNRTDRQVWCYVRSRFDNELHDMTVFIKNYVIFDSFMTRFGVTITKINWKVITFHWFAQLWFC